MTGMPRRISCGRMTCSGRRQRTTAALARALPRRQPERLPASQRRVARQPLLPGMLQPREGTTVLERARTTSRGTARRTTSSSTLSPRLASLRCLRPVAVDGTSITTGPGFMWHDAAFALVPRRASLGIVRDEKQNGRALAELLQADTYRPVIDRPYPLGPSSKRTATPRRSRRQAAWC